MRKTYVVIHRNKSEENTKFLIVKIKAIVKSKYENTCIPTPEHVFWQNMPSFSTNRRDSESFFSAQVIEKQIRSNFKRPLLKIALCRCFAHDVSSKRKKTEIKSSFLIMIKIYNVVSCHILTVDFWLYTRGKISEIHRNSKF